MAIQSSGGEHLDWHSEITPAERERIRRHIFTKLVGRSHCNKYSFRCLCCGCIVLLLLMYSGSVNPKYAVTNVVLFFDVLIFLTPLVYLTYHSGRILSKSASGNFKGAHKVLRIKCVFYIELYR